MKAFIMRRYGKKEPLYVVDVPEPTISDYDVLVQIHATAVNVLDAKIKSGEFKPLLSYGTPLILGHDLAGTVLRVGQHVKDFKVGDEVYARPADYRIGTFAQLIAVHQDDLALKPSTLNMEQAASIPLVGLTAWQALIDKANLQKGQKRERTG
jgi:NADPH:quinone reductase-like Zn-dependent oxidoreductase